MSVAGKEMDSTVVIGSAGILRGDGRIVAAGEGLDITFCLDSMKVSHAVIIDSLLLCRSHYDKNAVLSDSFNIDYVDFDTSLLQCRFRTSVPIAVHIQGEMLHAWESAFCKDKGITRREEIGPNTTAADSADTIRYRGKISFDTLDGVQTPELRESFLFGPARVFAYWNEDSSRSEVEYRFTVDLVPKGRRITLDKNDRFLADVEPVRFPFVSLSDAFQYPMKQTGKPASCATSLPWKKSITDSLRGKLEFMSAKAPVQLRLDVSDSTRIDSALIAIAIADPAASSGKSYRANASLGNITNATEKKLTIDLTDLINAFPDSVIFSCSSVFLAGSGLFLTNDRDPKTGEYQNNLKLRANILFNLRVPLD